MNLLLALKQLGESGLKIPLVLSGADFGNRAYVEDQILELGLQEQVHLLGFVPQGDLPALYRGALALTYVSFFGPENMPPLEAFAFGCPVIAANVSGAEEQMDGAALLVNPADPGEIAAAIRKVASDGNLRKRLVARGRKRAGRWTTDDFVHGAFSILDSFETTRHTWKN
jgi:glycosyltransferase involved in cell wall biosynthesis